MELGGKNYVIGKMDAKKQYHVMRRILPAAMALPELLVALDRFKDKPDAGALVGSALPFAQAIAAMSDDDSDFVINNCLKVVKREEGGRQAAILAPNGSLMYSDIDLAGMVALTIETLKENLGGFFPALMASVSGTPEMDGSNTSS